MEYALILFLMYLAAGAAFFAHPRGQAQVEDFYVRGQIAIFFDTLPLVLSWPLALWRMIRARSFDHD
jgi:hypothetical protein